MIAYNILFYTGLVIITFVIYVCVNVLIGAIKEARRINKEAKKIK